MATYTINLRGRLALEVRVYIDRGANTVSAYTLAFDEGANIRAETDAARYSGYCDAEIVYHEIHRTLAGRWGIESEDIAAAVDAQMPLCECD